MSIKKSLLVLAAAALASMAFASMAVASGGTVRDVEGQQIPMPAGTKLHYEGWAKFNVENVATFECHVTAETEAINDTTARVLNFTVPDTTKCHGTSALNGCTLTSHSLDNSTPTVTATATDFDVLGLKIHNTYSNCSTTTATLDFTTDASSFLTLKPLKTGTRVVTGTGGRLGTTAAAGEAIAGVEIEGTGTATTEQHIIFVPTHSANKHVVASGELEITGSNRCTWKLVTS